MSSRRSSKSETSHETQEGDTVVIEEAPVPEAAGLGEVMEAHSVDTEEGVAEPYQ